VVVTFHVARYLRFFLGAFLPVLVAHAYSISRTFRHVKLAMNS
jgi:hypothetical protein